MKLVARGQQVHNTFFEPSGCSKLLKSAGLCNALIVVQTCGARARAAAESAAAMRRQRRLRDELGANVMRTTQHVTEVTELVSI